MRTTPQIQFAESNYYPHGRTDERTSDFLVPRMEKALRAIMTLYQNFDLQSDHVPFSKSL